MMHYYITVVVIFNHFLLGMLLLFAPKITNLPNKLLAGLLLCIGGIYLITLFYYYPYTNLYSQLFGLEYALASCVGPFVFLYTYSYIRGCIPKARHNSHHFIIPLIFIIVFIGRHIFNYPDWKHQSILDAQLMSRLKYIGNVFVFAQVLAYFSTAYYLYRKALKKLSPKRKVPLKWLKTFFTFTLVFALCAVPLGIINYGRLTGMFMALFSLFYFIIIVWQSLSSSKIFGSEFMVLETKLIDLSKEATELIEIIENRRLYANKELSLELLACQLEMSKQQITTIFNSHLGVSFTDFINNLRVKEAKIKLLDPYYDLFTIEAIGLEVGFGSRSTFYELFKKYTGLTPSEFKMQRKVISG